ncbi:MAG: hypothetical protein ACKVY0_27320 [Prosthecobacter sp.]|uniref:hypothetical protein n=1 Tax=Prosthecobacter sp. TaxID=1965333 RepID=UPI0039033209
MKRGDFLKNWGLSSLKPNLGFMAGRFFPSEPDKAAPLTLTFNVVRDKTCGKTIETKY